MWKKWGGKVGSVGIDVGIKCKGVEYMHIHAPCLPCRYFELFKVSFIYVIFIIDIVDSVDNQFERIENQFSTMS